MWTTIKQTTIQRMRSVTFDVVTEKTFTPLNDPINEWLAEQKVDVGLVHVFSRHTTMGIRILENETLSLADLLIHLQSVAPSNKDYLHDIIGIRDVPADERINGVSHVRSLYMNHSEIIPVRDSKLYLGEWQTLMAVELDGCRKREVVVTLL